MPNDPPATVRSRCPRAAARTSTSTSPGLRAGSGTSSTIGGAPHSWNRAARISLAPSLYGHRSSARHPAREARRRALVQEGQAERVVACGLLVLGPVTTVLE